MKKLYNFLIKFLLCIILFLFLAIFSKGNIEFRNYIQQKVYKESLSFSSFKKFYNDYLGGVFPSFNISSLEMVSVFDEKLSYSSVFDYEDGAVLFVSQGYVVPNLEDGVVVYIGEKEKYGNVVIIEGNDGIHIWYGNLCNVMVKLYDTVSKGDYLGESCDESIYLVYSKGNQFLDYRDYLE